MKRFGIIIYLFCFSFFAFAQDDNLALDKAKPKDAKPHIALYKIYNIEKDTTYVDTTLSILQEYKHNLLRKDIFGLLPFANEGQSYTVLDFATVKFSDLPSIGFKAKHFNYLEKNDIKYYHVPTPFTDLYYKSVMEQGQTLDAFFTTNLSKQFNFSIAYKGLKSIGKYINAITSSGNFRFTTSYQSKNNKYYLNAHFTSQDISNQENGGIKDVYLFNTSEEPYNERERLDVYFRDASSLLQGKGIFINHSYNFKNIAFTHEFSHDYKFFNFSQSQNERLGSAFVSKINNKTRYNNLYNSISVAFNTKLIGRVKAFIEDYNYNYYYNSAVLDNLGNIIVPNAISDRISSFGAEYMYKYSDKLDLKINAKKSFTNQNVENILLQANYNFNKDFKIIANYKKQNSIPQLNALLYQSDYVNYNWYNNFVNEKFNEITLNLQTKWINIKANSKFIKDYIYFTDTSTLSNIVLVKPFQYNKTINYASVKAQKEIKYKKWALDNTILYQQVTQEDNILNGPKIVTRNTIYYSDYVFKKAMFLQTGVTLNYFTTYFANNYNPLIGEFSVQNNTKIGNFPMLDFFVNAQIRTARIYLKAEHFNSAITGYNFFNAPNYPYRDFIVRLGLEWNFFK